MVKGENGKLKTENLKLVQASENQTCLGFATSVAKVQAYIVWLKLVQASENQTCLGFQFLSVYLVLYNSEDFSLGLLCKSLYLICFVYKCLGSRAVFKTCRVYFYI